MVPYKFPFILFPFIIFSLFLSCTDEESPKPTPSDSTANEWIEETMRKYYYWYEDIPEKNKLNFSLEPDQFFYSLLSDKDGKTRPYSTINKKTTNSRAYMGERYSFGFEFLYYRVQENPNVYALRILYVAPGSPAANAGLKRDSWIYELNGRPLPDTNNTSEITDMLYASSSSTIRFGVLDENSTALRQIEITSIPDVTDNPVYVYKTFPLVNGKKAGYLLYNHFTAGPVNNGQDETFNNSLRDALARIKTEKPEDFILDLRYNGGGLVSSARLLSTMLAPANALGDVFCNLIYNTNKDNNYQDQTLYLDPKLATQGSQVVNLDIKRLFVITSNWTASASEAVINGLSPYLGLNQNLIIMGNKTEGKNVGSITFDDDRYEWELHPIVSKISNKNNDSDYADGFHPTAGFNCVETQQDIFYELGDEREFMLKQLLNYINYGTAIDDGRNQLKSAGNKCLTPLYNSLERKRLNGVLLSPAI